MRRIADNFNRLAEQLRECAAQLEGMAELVDQPDWWDTLPALSMATALDVEHACTELTGLARELQGDGG